MIQRFAFGAALAISIVAPGCGVAGEGVGSTSADVSQVPNQTDWANGTRWTYESNFQGLPHAWVYRPQSFSPKSPSQHGVIFHLGGCGVMTYQAAQGAGWPAAAEAAGMVIVIPEIVAPAYPNTEAPNVACYNFGAGLASAPTANSPDHKAIIAAAKKIVTDTTLQVDPRQVYIAGFSAGATVAMQIGCMAPDVFAGIGSVAGPSMGTDQSKSVMPPTTTASSVQSACTSYAGSLKDKLATQLYAIVSDNNGLPAGNPVLDANGNWTADKFEKQTIWDGDKYVPHAHHAFITGAEASIMNVQQTTTAGALPSTAAGQPFAGSGVGCPGGEASHDDTGETDCPFGHATSRNWAATADVWTDAQGRKRIVHISQDTLRHRWPAGPVGSADVAVTPTMDDLVSGGLFDTSSGLFAMDKVDAAPNGELGVLYFGHDTFSFPMFFVDYLASNNPRLSDPTPPPPPPPPGTGTTPPPPPPPPPSGSCVTAKNSAHVAAARAYYGLAFHAYAVGSNTDLGGATLADDETTSLNQTSTNFWAKVDSCP